MKKLAFLFRGNQRRPLLKAPCQDLPKLPHDRKYLHLGPGGRRVVPDCQELEVCLESSQDAPVGPGIQIHAEATSHQYVPLRPQAHLRPRDPTQQHEDLLGRVEALEVYHTGLLYCSVDCRGNANLDYALEVEQGLEEELQWVRLPDGVLGHGCGLGHVQRLWRASESGCEPASARALTLMSVSE